jgi:hypothetical protein
MQKKIHILCGSAEYLGLDIPFFRDALSVIFTVSVIRINSAAIYGLFMHARSFSYATLE